MWTTPYSDHGQLERMDAGQFYVQTEFIFKCAMYITAQFLDRLNCYLFEYNRLGYKNGSNSIAPIKNPIKHAKLFHSVTHLFRLWMTLRLVQKVSKHSVNQLCKFKYCNHSASDVLIFHVHFEFRYKNSQVHCDDLHSY